MQEDACTASTRDVRRENRHESVSRTWQMWDDAHLHREIAHHRRGRAPPPRCRCMLACCGFSRACMVQQVRCRAGDASADRVDEPFAVFVFTRVQEQRWPTAIVDAEARALAWFCLRSSPSSQNIYLT
eukprot:6172427-Pleurochrysis_carterae.AAC.1